MLMRLLLLTLLPTLVSGCVPEIPVRDDPPNPLCVGTRAARADLASTLAVSTDDAAVISGARLIDIIDAGCAQ